MTTFLFVQGMDPIELAPGESFNKARARANQALTGTDHKGNADPNAKKRPMHKLTFKTVVPDADNEDDFTIGRISINPEKFIGVGSDEERDAGGGDDEDDE